MVVSGRGVIGRILVKKTTERQCGTCSSRNLELEIWYLLKTDYGVGTYLYITMIIRDTIYTKRWLVVLLRLLVRTARVCGEVIVWARTAGGDIPVLPFTDGYTVPARLFRLFRTTRETAEEVVGTSPSMSTARNGGRRKFRSRVRPYSGAAAFRRRHQEPPPPPPLASYTSMRRTHPLCSLWPSCGPDVDGGVVDGAREQLSRRALWTTAYCCPLAAAGYQDGCGDVRNVVVPRNPRKLVGNITRTGRTERRRARRTRNNGGGGLSSFYMATTTTGDWPAIRRVQCRQTRHRPRGVCAALRARRFYHTCVFRYHIAATRRYRTMMALYHFRVYINEFCLYSSFFLFFCFSC